MKHLSELRKLLQEAETQYKTAKTSLDNSLEYILYREELKQARFRYDAACRQYVEVNVFGNFIEEELEQ